MKKPLLVSLGLIAIGTGLFVTLNRTSQDPTPEKETQLAKENASELARLQAENARLKQSLDKALDQAQPEPEPKAAETAPAAPANNLGDAIRNMLSSGNIETMMKQRATASMNRELDKLTMRLKLTPDQVSQLKAYYEARNAKHIELVQTMLKSGDLMSPGMESRIKELRDSETADQEFVDSLLTPEQREENTRLREETKIANAERYAQSQVDRIDRDVGLGAEQKDALYAAFAKQRMDSGETDNSPSPHGEADSEPSGNDVLGSVLTPEQMEVLSRRRAERATEMQQMMQLFQNARQAKPATEGQ